MEVERLRDKIHRVFDIALDMEPNKHARVHNYVYRVILMRLKNLATRKDFRNTC